MCLSSGRMFDLGQTPGLDGAHARVDRSPADHTIALLGCLSGAATMIVVGLVAMISGAPPLWIGVGPAAAALLAGLAWWSWQLVRRHGFYHRADEEDEEDENPEGGSRVRFPPEAPDGGGSLAFDWERFLMAFWEHVEATSRERPRDPVGV